MSRYYKFNGKSLPSVTTICGILDKPALVGWAANQACDYILDQLGDFDSAIRSDKMNVQVISNIIERARTEFRKSSKKAMGIGSNVHTHIEYLLNTGKEPATQGEAELAGYLAFLEWEQQHHLQVIETEHTVYSERYAGTCDLVCMLDGKKYLIDFKTSSMREGVSAYIEHRLQTAAYRQTDNTINGNGILYLNKITGYPQWRDVSSTYERDRDTFNALVEVFYLLHPIIDKRVKEGK